MRAVRCVELGPFTNLELVDIPDTEVGKGQIRIAMRAASLNFPDLLVVQGLYQIKADPPFTPGAEGAGVVSEVGEGVQHHQVGDRVAAVGATGAFADQWVIDADAATQIPDGVDFITAASLILAYGTSYHALVQRANLREGETLLVLGAAGGVGAAAVELGKAMGATVIAAASTAAKLDFCRSLGADSVINYSEENLKDQVKTLTGGRGVDVVFDPVGGDLSERALRSIAWKGRYLVIGFAAGDIPKISLNLPLLKGASIVGVWWGSFVQHEPEVNDANRSAIFDMLASGSLSPRITNVYPLAEYREAFDMLASRRAMGKVVLSISDPSGVGHHEGL